MGQIRIGITCTECREQYAAAGRNDVPCDIGRCKYTPSPGDTTETGCGLSPQNEFAVWFYPRWKAFGDLAFKFINVELSEEEASLLLEKLLLIEQYSAKVHEAAQKRLQPKKRRR